MKPPFIERYKGYVLNCAPQATHDGAFLAFLIITHGAEPVQVDRAEALDLPGFVREGDAGLAALSAAMRWVDDVATRAAEPPAKARAPIKARSAAAA